MANELNLKLPERTILPPSRSKAVPVLLTLVLLIGVANLVLVSGVGKDLRSTNGGARPEAMKDLALKFEKQELVEPAAEAWKEYLITTSVSAPEQAAIWYRLGKLHQQAGKYERALSDFYRSESLAKVDELSPEISRRVQECLEALGKFTALQNDLTGRVGLEKNAVPAGDEVLARIGTQNFTKADLDREIESQIDRQMAQYAAFAPPDEINKQKEELLKRLSSSTERQRMLNQYVAEEVLYRKAREDRLGEVADTRAILKDAERKILARRVLEKALADQIKITSGDLETYYQANKSQYVQSERAKIGFILLKEKADAEKVLVRLKGGEKFETLAKELSLDEATKAKGGAVEDWTDKNGGIPGIGQNAELTAAIFTTEAGKLADKPIATDKGFVVLKVTTREPERQKEFQEVRNDVYQALRTRKENEVQQSLFEQLKNRYNVVIYNDKFAKPATQPNDATK